MRINTLFSIVLISVLGTCLSYKLRRDIRKVRHYCREICTQCGGEAALSRDVCVCSIEEAEGEDFKHCLERARNKFEFLGIKLETDNGSENKRSVHKTRHSSHPEEQDAYLHREPDEEKRSLFKRSSIQGGIHNSGYPKHIPVHDGGPIGADDKLRSKRSYRDYGNRFEIPRFADLFQEHYPVRSPTKFKILFGSSSQPGLERGLNYDTARDRSDQEDSSDEDDTNEGSDYADGQIALSDELNLRRLGNKESNIYDIIPPPDVSSIDDTIAKEFTSIWNSVLLEVLNPNYYVPQNFADNGLFL